MFDRTFIKLAGNEDIHKILDEFDLGADRAVHMSYLSFSLHPLMYNRENVVQTIATYFLSDLH